MTELSGQCFCGAVSFTYTGEALGVITCHCRDCQQMHGNLNAMAALDREAVQITGASLTWFASSEKARRGFCAACGSRLFKDNHGSPKLMVSMGAFSGSTGLKDFKHIWTQSKGDWYELPETTEA